MLNRSDKTKATPAEKSVKQGAEKSEMAFIANTVPLKVEPIAKPAPVFPADSGSLAVAEPTTKIPPAFPADSGSLTVAEPIAKPAPTFSADSGSVEKIPSEPPTFWQKHGQKIEWLLVMVLTIGAFLLRRKGLATQSLWFDEADLISRAHADVPSILATFTRPGENGPLYTLFMHFWMSFVGSGEAAVRTPSMLAGTASVPMLYLVGKKLNKNWLGLGAAFLLTISPYNIWYSQDAKMYPAAMLLTLTSLFIFLTAIEKNKISWWVAFVVITTASYYVHLMTVLIVGVEVLYLLLARPYRFSAKNSEVARRTRRNTLISLGLLTLPYLPIALWQLIALKDGSLGKTWFQPVGLLDMLNSLTRRFAVNRSLEPFETLGMLIFAGLVIFGLTMLWSQAFRNKLRLVAGKNAQATRLAIFLSLYFLLPIIAFYLLTMRIPLYADRYLLIASPAYYLLTALALIQLWQLRRWWFRASSILALVAVISLVGVALKSYNYSTEPQKEDWRGAMQWLSSQVRPGDVVFVIPGYLDTAVDYYFHPQQGVDVRTISQDLLDDHNDAATNTFLLNTIHDYDRAWLVVSPERYADDEPTEVVQKKWFNWNTLMFADPKEFVGVAIYGYSFREHPGTNVPFATTHPTNYQFGQDLQLQGYDMVKSGAGPDANLSGTEATYGNYLHLTFYWQKLTNSNTNYQITVRLLDANGKDTGTDYISQALSGYHPTSSWHSGDSYRDFRDLYIHVPPGQYQIAVSVAPVNAPNNAITVTGQENNQSVQNATQVILQQKVTVK